MTSSARVFDSFRADHRRVLSCLAELERGITGDGRRVRLPARAETEFRSMVTLLFQQFASHMNAEEHVLYPALVESFPEARASLDPLRAEHGEMRNMLLRLDELLGRPRGPARDEQVVVQTRDLADLLRIHIRKEEHTVFNVACRVLTPAELERLADRVAAHRSPTGAAEGRPTRKGHRS